MSEELALFLSVIVVSLFSLQLFRHYNLFSRIIYKSKNNLEFHISTGLRRKNCSAHRFCIFIISRIITVFYYFLRKSSKWVNTPIIFFKERYPYYLNQFENNLR